MKRWLNDRSLNSSGGFTVLEMALVLIIIAVLGMGLIYVVKAGLAALRQEQALRIATNAQKAVDGLVVRGDFNRYPCPANPATLPGDATYGQEDCTLATVPGTNNQTAGTVMVGYLPDYIETTTGWIPMTSLLPQEDLIQTNLRDPWGHRLIYAVTTSLSAGVKNGGSFQDNINNGQIMVVDENGVPVGKSTGATGGQAQYVLISQGQYNDIECQGQDPAALARPLEYDNCTFTPDADADTLLEVNATFVSGLRSSSIGAGYFDDILVYKEDRTETLWSGDSSNNFVADLTNSNPAENRQVIFNPVSTVGVGIGTETPDPAVKLHVTGSVRVGAANTNAAPPGAGMPMSGGAVMANVICNASDCLSFQDTASVFDFDSSCTGNTGYYPYKTEYDATSDRINILCKALEAENIPSPGTQCASNLVKGIYTDGEVQCVAGP